MRMRTVTTMTTHRTLTDDLYLTYTRLLEALAECNPLDKYDFCQFCGRSQPNERPNQLERHEVSCPWRKAKERVDYQHAPSPESKIIARVEAAFWNRFPNGAIVTLYKAIEPGGMLGKVLDARRVNELLATGDALVCNRGNEQYLLVWLDTVCPNCLSHLTGEGDQLFCPNCQGGESNDKS